MPYSNKRMVEMDRKQCLDKAADAVMRSRTATYGEPKDVFGATAAAWSAILGMQVKPHEVALCMAALKVARAAANPQHSDSWVDIAGYAACGSELVSPNSCGQAKVEEPQAEAKAKAKAEARAKAQAKAWADARAEAQAQAQARAEEARPWAEAWARARAEEARAEAWAEAWAEVWAEAKAEEAEAPPQAQAWAEAQTGKPCSQCGGRNVDGVCQEVGCHYVEPR